MNGEAHFAEVVRVLTSEQVKQFEQDGYTVQPLFLSASEVEGALGDIRSICAGATVANHDASRLEMESNQGPQGTFVRRIYEPSTYYPRFRALSESQDMLDSLEQLLGPHLTFHYSKINLKPQSIGAVVEWHQDLAYYPLTNNDSLAVLLYLDDASQLNGCLKVVPRKHKKPLMDHTTGGFFQGKITEPVDESEGVFVEGKAGAAIFMHGMTPHYSAPNTSQEPRRTLILSYRAADAFPIYVGGQTDEFESHVRHVRGEPKTVARLASGHFPIPRFPGKIKSLYELQELSRTGEATR
jgi:phytanoyl-CoA hydroxylase